jgi:hypothetical protein
MHLGTFQNKALFAFMSAFAFGCASSPLAGLDAFLCVVEAEGTLFCVNQLNQTEMKLKIENAERYLCASPDDFLKILKHKAGGCE